MAWIVTGSRGRLWHGADWIVRNAFEFLVPALERAGATALAERCQNALVAGNHCLDLSDLLDDERRSQKWLRALESSLGRIESEGAAAWNEPRRFPVFVGAVKRLALLTRADGNRLVISLAQAERGDSLR
ncbi:MAG: hypothetical protein ACREM8_02860 [Vulcanimicrobiaceae bacterium]